MVFHAWLAGNTGANHAAASGQRLANTDGKTARNIRSGIARQRDERRATGAGVPLCAPPRPAADGATGSRTGRRPASVVTTRAQVVGGRCQCHALAAYAIGSPAIAPAPIPATSARRQTPDAALNLTPALGKAPPAP